MKYKLDKDLLRSKWTNRDVKSYVNYYIVKRHKTYYLIESPKWYVVLSGACIATILAPIVALVYITKFVGELGNRITPDSTFIEDSLLSITSHLREDIMYKRDFDYYGLSDLEKDDDKTS